MKNSHANSLVEQGTVKAMIDVTLDASIIQREGDEFFIWLDKGA